MDADEWNKEDGLELELHFPPSAMDPGFERLDEMLEIIESTGEEFRPKKMSLRRRKLKYSRQKLRERLHEGTFRKHTSFGGYENDLTSVVLRVYPFSVFAEPGKAEERAGHMVNLARALASRFPVTAGFAHNGTDALLDMNEEQMRARDPENVERVYWLNLYGPRMVEQLGRQRVLSTPAFLLEELPGGAVLWLTRPTPADFASEEARFAQARALVHLRPELKLEDTLATLRRRSLAFVPVEPRFDPDIADLLTLTLQRSGLQTKHWDVERLVPPGSPGAASRCSRRPRGHPPLRAPVRRATRRDPAYGGAFGDRWLPRVPTGDRLLPVVERLGPPVPRGRARASHHLAGRLPGHGAGAPPGRAMGAEAQARRGRRRGGSRQAVLDFSLTQLYRQALRLSHGASQSL
jgi:hypothetical protein